MKKALLTFCFAAFTLAAFAQLPSFGVKGGVNLSSQSITASGTNISVASGTLINFNAGVFVDFKFGNLSLQPALNFTGKGGKYNGDAVDDNGNDAGTESLTENLYYLQLPVNLVYHIPVLIGNVYFGAGPYIAQGIICKVKFSGATGDNTTIDPVHFGNADGDLKAQQYGADFILGLQLKTGFLINANYDLGLSNDAVGADSGGSIKSHVFGFSVGYKF